MPCRGGVVARFQSQRAEAAGGQAGGGVLTAALGIKEQSLAKGGALMDGWITAGVDAVREAAGQAPETAEAAADTAGAAAVTAGDTLEAGAATTAETPRIQ